MKGQDIFKKILTVATMAISFLGFSQDNNSITDSIFRVIPNSINENNYYLVYRTDREYPELVDRPISLNWSKVSLETIWFDCNNFQIQQGDTLICTKQNEVLNGTWYLKRPWVSIKGEFVDGLANGNWDKIEKHNKETIHTHQEFILGIPNGEWYEEVNGKKIYSHIFKNGKPNGLWTTFLRKEESPNSRVHDKIEINYTNGVRNGLTVFSKDNIVKCSFNYLNGVMDGKFIADGDFLGCYEEKFALILNGEFSNGKLVNNLDVFKYDKITKSTYLWRKLEILEKTKYSEFYPNGNLKSVFEYEPNNEKIVLLKEIYGKFNFISVVGCNSVEGMISCNCKKMTYDEQGKVVKVEYFGSDDYLKKNTKN